MKKKKRPELHASTVCRFAFDCSLDPVVVVERGRACHLFSLHCSCRIHYSAQAAYPLDVYQRGRRHLYTPPPPPPLSHPAALKSSKRTSKHSTQYASTLTSLSHSFSKVRQNEQYLQETPRTSRPETAQRQFVGGGTRAVQNRDAYVCKSRPFHFFYPQT